MTSYSHNTTSWAAVALYGTYFSTVTCLMETWPCLPSYLSHPGYSMTTSGPIQATVSASWRWEWKTCHLGSKMDRLALRVKQKKKKHATQLTRLLNLGSHHTFSYVTRVMLLSELWGAIEVKHRGRDDVHYRCPLGLCLQWVCEFSGPIFSYSPHSWCYNLRQTRCEFLFTHISRISKRSK